jgi:hypothetical protein
VLLGAEAERTLHFIRLLQQSAVAVVDLMQITVFPQLVVLVAVVVVVFLETLLVPLEQQGKDSQEETAYMEATGQAVWRWCWRNWRERWKRHSRSRRKRWGWCFIIYNWNGNFLCWRWRWLF